MIIFLKSKILISVFYTHAKAMPTIRHRLSLRIIHYFRYAALLQRGG